MSNLKYDAIIKQGITIKNRVSIPSALIPADAMVEVDAKKAAGYFSDCILGKEELGNNKERDV